MEGCEINNRWKQKMIGITFDDQGFMIQVGGLFVACHKHLNRDHKTKS